jgi:hypothetical protein
MTIIKKIFATAFIAVFLASIPLTFAGNKSDIVQVVFELKDDGNYVKGGSPGGSKPSPDYKFWFNGYEPVTPVPMTIYTDNSEGLISAFVTSAITSAFTTWANAVPTVDLVGTITIDSENTGAVGRDYQNSIMFGTYSNSKVIAVTYAWVNRASKQLVEFDILFNVYYSWGNALDDSALMDLQNIATHELGHAFNLNDIYDQSKSALTMYGYSNEGDTAKRTLELGDIAGIQAVFAP